MTADAPQHPRAFVVRFKELTRWDPASYHGMTWHWTLEVLRPIGSVLRSRKLKIDLQATPFEGLQPITVHFDGSVSRRQAKREYSLQLFAAMPGDLVVSKIDLKNGALGFVPEGWDNVAVTGHFAVYELDRSQILPEYLRRVIQLSSFKNHLWRNKVGAEGRKEVKLDFFEQQLIPLLPLAVQQAIVDCWQQGRRRAQELDEQAPMLEREALEAVRQILGRIRTSTVRPKVFVLPWSLLGQWGFEAGIRAQLPPTQASFPEVLISQVCTISSGGTPPRYRKDYFGGPIPWVKTTEVRDAVIEGTEETLTEAGLQSSSARVYPQGSLIVAMYGQGATRGRTAKLGIEAATNQACAVLTNFDSRIEPDYLWVYLMSEYEHLRALASGNNQPNLNAGMIATYPLPLPPLDVQRELVARVAEARAEAGRLRKEARRLREETRAEVEAMILGTGLAATADS